ncbi:MAG: NADH-quinone oxidoreductase subunit N [Actinomycetota bacterium]|nr:NADH-quinone oxidoreductase subunit N [Actinomycetota bacterium]
MIPTPPLSFPPILPELVLTGAAIVGLLYEAVARRPNRNLQMAIGIAGVIGAAAATIPLWNWTGPVVVMGNMVSVDRFSVVSRLLLLSIAAMGILLGAHYLSRSGDAHRGEFFPLVLFATVGMTLITAAADLIVVFLALEILSLSLYVLTGITGRRGSNEAAMKYFLLGAFSSAFFLYGVAMAYGATNSTRITAIANALAGRTGSQGLALLALAFLAVGFGFKVSAAPFHMWTPDVYEGAPTTVTAFMATATKAAAFAAFLRIFSGVMVDLQPDWTAAISTIAVISMVVGNVAALVQSNMKRMLAYSSVAQAGYLLIGVAVGSIDGAQAVIYYLLAYGAMTMAAFAVVIIREREVEDGDTIAALTGYGRARPVIGVVLTLAMLSLAGFPPLSGFVGKFLLFGSAVEADMTWLAIVGALGSIVSLGYYLRVVTVAWLPPPAGGPRKVLAIPGPVGIATVGCGVAIVVISLMASPLLDACRGAAQSLLAP